MGRHYFTKFLLLFFPYFTTLYAITLQQTVIESIQTNPLIQEKLRDYRSSQQDLKIVESEYYPKIDLKAHYKINKTKELEDDKTIYSNYGASLTLSHNIFNGFESAHKTKYQEAHILFYAYNYLNAVNQVTLDMASAYINILRYDESVKIAIQNVRLYENLAKEVLKLYKKGKVSLSEFNQIKASIAWGKIDLKEKINRVENVKSLYRKILGRMPDLAQMQPLNFQLAIPKDLQTASLYAINNNPALLSFTYKVKTIQELKNNMKKVFILK